MSHLLPLSKFTDLFPTVCNEECNVFFQQPCGTPPPPHPHIHTQPTQTKMTTITVKGKKVRLLNGP